MIRPPTKLGPRLAASVVASLSLLATSSAFAQINPEYEAVGPIDVQTRYQRPAVAVHFPLDAGQTFQVVATHEDAAASTYERYHGHLPVVTLRVTDPGEQLIHYRVIDTAVAAADYPALAADDLAAGRLATAELQAAQTGVYTVRMSAGYEHSKLWVGLPPGTAHALSYGNGIWQDWRATPSPLWVWVPQHTTRDTAVELRHERGSFTIVGPGDAWSQNLTTGTWSQTVAPGSGGELWRLEGLSDDWQMRAGGDVPVIAATSPEFAEALGASVHTIVDGPMAGDRVSHLFQKRMAEQQVPALLGLIGEAAELRGMVDAALQSPECQTPSDAVQARRAIALLSRDVPAVAWALENWRFGAEATSHPFVDAENSFSLAPILARLFSYHHPCNPWGPSSPDSTDGRPELVARAALAAIAQIMELTEDERLAGGPDAWSNYPGSPAFDVGDRTWTHALVAPQLRAALPTPLGDDVLAAYTDAMRRLTIDRRYAEGFVSARNQSSFYVPAIGALALNRDEPLYEIAARAYAERFAASADAAGWFPESLGPDLTYNGITHAELSQYYTFSSWMPGCSDQNVRRALVDSYTFFNATVAPEPQGNMLGGFNFGHRTNWGFYAEQFGGARSKARDIPEVALWSTPDDATLGELQPDVDEAIRRFDEMLSRVPQGVSTLLARFIAFVSGEAHDFPSRHGELAWPAENPQTDRLFDDEMYVVRRNGYYAVVYVGNPAPSTFYTDQKMDYLRRAAPPSGGCPPLHISTYEDTGNPFPGWNETFCSGSPGFGAVHPFVGGGLSLVWSPDFGAGLLAANWSPVVHHGVVGQRVHPDSNALERTWERYETAGFTSANRDGVETSGTVPIYYGAADELDYARLTTFGDNDLEVQITLTNNTATSQPFDSLWENLPFPVCAANCEDNRKGRIVGFADAQGAPLQDGDHVLDVVNVADENGHGWAVEPIDGARPMSLGSVGLIRESYGLRLQIGRVEIPFDTSTLDPGQSTTLHYRLRTLDPVDSVRPVPEVPDEPQVVCPAGVEWEGGADGGADGGGAGASAAGAGAQGDDSGGCGCRTASPMTSPWGWGAWAMLALTLRFRKRR